MIAIANKFEALKWALFSIMTGALVLFGLNVLFDVHLELFGSIADYFKPRLFIGLVLTPFIAGVVVSLIYGLGGKVLCYFPALIVYLFQYFSTAFGDGTIPDNVRLLPIGYMGFIIIVAIEASAVGGILGEVWVKKTYGRKPRHLVYKPKKEKTEN